MRTRIQTAYWALLAIVVPLFAIIIIGALIGVWDEYTTDPIGATIAVVSVTFAMLVLLLMLAGLKITISIDPEIQWLHLPYWHATDGVRPGRWYPALLFVQPLFSREERIPLTRIGSILICKPDNLESFRQQYKPGSIAREIIDYRIARYEQSGRAWQMESQVFTSNPDLVFAVETKEGELIYRALYTVRPDDVLALAKRIGTKHPEIIRLRSGPQQAPTKRN